MSEPAPGGAPSSRGSLRRALGVGAVGALAFWVVNLLISLTPVGATYRGGLSIAYAPMLVESAVGGLLIGWAVSLLLLRFYDRIPGRNAVRKSLAITLVAILAFAVASVILDPDQPIALALLGVAINLLRFLALGWAIGYVSARGGVPVPDATRAIARRPQRLP